MRARCASTTGRSSGTRGRATSRRSRRRSAPTEGSPRSHGTVPLAREFALRRPPGPPSPGTGRSRARAAVPHLSLGPGLASAAARGHLRHRPRPLRADGSRRAHQDQERGRRDGDVPPLLPRGHLRLLRDEHRRRQHARLHAADRRHHGRGSHLPAAAPAGREGPRAGPDAVLRAVRRGRALAQVRIGAARRPASAARRRRTRSTSTGRRPASCAPAARRPARATGGTPTASSDPRRCSRAIAGSSTRATARRRSASPNSTRPSSCIAATRS